MPVRAPQPPQWMGQLVAAARVIDGVDKEVRNDLMPGETREDREAWFFYEHVSEVSSFISGKAGLLSQIVFFIGTIAPDGTRVPARDPKTGQVREGLDRAAVEAAEAALRRYTDAAGSRQQIIYSQTECWDVVGDGYLIGYAVNEKGDPVEDEDPSKVGEEFKFVAKGALARKEVGEGYRLQATRTQAIDLPSSTVVRRMTRPHPRYPDEGKGWVKAALEPCRDLFFFSLAQRAAAKSNLPADVWVVPAEASPKAINPDGWGPGNEGALTDGGPEQGAAQSQSMAAYLEQMLGEFVSMAMTEVTGGNGVMPAFLSIEERLVERFKKISFARPIDAQLHEAIEQARVRLAESSDGEAEDMSGVGGSGGISRWNGAKLDADRYRRYLKPTADVMADQWTFAVVHHELRTRRLPVASYEQLRVCVDASAIVVPPDLAAAATEGVRIGAVGYSFWREAHGIPDTAAPTEEDFRIMERMRVSSESHENQGKGRGDQGPPDSRTPSNETAATGTLTAAGAPADDVDEMYARLLGIEYAALGRLESAAEVALDEALRRAGAKLRNWARSSTVNETLPVAIQRVELAEVVATLGPERCAQLAAGQYEDDDRRAEDLFAAALVALLATFERVVRQAYEQAEREYGARVRAEEISANIERGKEALRAGMLKVADQVVFGPGAQEAEGEQVAGIRVPTTVLRAALAIAGGMVLRMALRPTTEMIELPVVNGTIATASLVFGPTLASVAPPATGLRWAYGPEYRSAPFEPHLALDGTPFTSQTDPVLAGSPFSIGNGFYAPGDHAGCRCYAVPTNKE